MVRDRLLRRGLHLEAFTISWNVIEAVVAVGAGYLAGSIALVGFGLDSTIETIAAVALYRRLRAERNGATEKESEAHERTALWVVGITFYLLSAYVLLLGLVANASMGWWWADPAAALVMVPWLVTEGVEGVSEAGDEHCSGPSRSHPDDS